MRNDLNRKLAAVKRLMNEAAVLGLCIVSVNGTSIPTRKTHREPVTTKTANFYIEKVRVVIKELTRALSALISI